MAEQVIRAARTVDEAGPNDARRSNPAGPAGTATAIHKSGNSKTGKVSATYAAQASCPNGINSSHRCPLLGIACYGEEGPPSWVMKPLNAKAGINPKGDASKTSTTPKEVAQDEAAALDGMYSEWNKNKFPLRLHVVGDCVTPEAARIVGKAASRFAYRYPGDPKENARAAPPGAKSVWAYTHAWRDVPRGDWPRNISVLASVDKPGDLSSAHSRGYGCAIVVDNYTQTKTGNYGAAYPISGGFKVIPCPHEVQRIVDEAEVELIKAALRLHKKQWEKGFKMPQKWRIEDARKAAEQYLTKEEISEINRQQAESFRGKGGTGGSRKNVQCLHCKLCWMDDFLYETKGVIAFALHGDGAKKRYSSKVKNLIQIG